MSRLQGCLTVKLLQGLIGHAIPNQYEVFALRFVHLVSISIVVAQR
jgi:hypothetical protein